MVSMTRGHVDAASGVSPERVDHLLGQSVTAPLPLATHRAFYERYRIPILEAYGATEFGGPVTMMTPDLHREWGERKLGSVGRSYRGAQLRAVYERAAGGPR